MASTGDKISLPQIKVPRMKFDVNNRAFGSFSHKKSGTGKKKDPPDSTKNILINVIHEEYFSDERHPEENMHVTFSQENKKVSQAGD